MLGSGISVTIKRDKQNIQHKQNSPSEDSSTMATNKERSCVYVVCICCADCKTPCMKGNLKLFYIYSQVPYETLNKRFRAAQKNIDRETSHVTMVVAELEKTLSNFPVVDSVVSLLDGVVEKLSALKRKV